MQEINHKALQMEKVLKALSPNALRMLERSLGVSLSAGTAGPNADLMLHTIRKLSGYPCLPEMKLSVRAPLKRAILAPLQPFLVPQTPKDRQLAMIDSAQLEPVWAYAQDTLIATELDEAVAALESLSAVKDVPATHDLMRKAIEMAAGGLRQRLVSAGKRQLEDAHKDESAQKRLRRRLGGYATFEVFQETLHVLEKAGDWEQVMVQTKPFPENLLSLRYHDALDPMRSYITENPKDAAYLAALAYMRLDEAPVELMKLAQALASEGALPPVLAAPYSAMVDYALSAIEQSITLVESWIDYDEASVGMPEAARLSLVHFDELGMLESFEDCTVWQERAFTLKRQLCEILRNELKTLPSLLENAIAKETVPEDKPGFTPLSHDKVNRSYQRCLRGLKLAKLATQYAGTLGLNELQSATRDQVERFIDRNSEKLLNTPADTDETEEGPSDYGDISRRLSRLISMSEISMEPEDTANLIRRQKTYLKSAA